jgi:hypothetical protein
MKTVKPSHSCKRQRPQKRSSRPRPEWVKRDLPAFLDASASVSATTFGARRLPEIKALWRVEKRRPLLQATTTVSEGLASGGGKTASRHLRRRATSHKSRRRHRFPTGTEDNDKALTATTTKATTTARPCRRARRKPALLIEQHQVWATTSVETTTVNWMPTHVWHTKRFHIDTIFGWKVPLQHANRGARAALRMVKEGHSTIQDVTWRNACLVVGCKQLSTLISSLQRFCPLLLAENSKSILSGASFGEGMLHEMDSFPRLAIGPAKWWISRMMPFQGTCQDTNWCWAHFFVHPCILITVESMLAELSKVQDWESVRRIGIATLQLRGRDATSDLLNALKNNQDNTSEKIDEGIPHLAAIGITGKENFVKSYNNQLENVNQETSFKEGRTIVVRQMDRVDAAGVIGWDIVCLPSTAKGMFIDLCTCGTSRAIGLVEEAYLCLEADPPVPSFPRDYPDTPSGQLYWDPGSDQDMIRVRQTLENGWGRLKPEKASSVVQWKSLVGEDENGVVVVRGNFGQPFLHLMHDGASSHAFSQDSSSIRRPRRKVRPLGSLVVAPPLSRGTASQHVDACKTLLASLSLPAVIPCQLRVDGRGTIGAGNRLSAVIAGETVVLGYATMGSFSTTTGLCRGTGFISAARFLTLLRSNSGPIFVIEPSTQNIGIRVAYDDDEGNTKGMVALFISI